jgi:hypothetical protein
MYTLKKYSEKAEKCIQDGLISPNRSNRCVINKNRKKTSLICPSLSAVGNTVNPEP